MCYGTLRCLTLRFCHIFQKISRPTNEEQIIAQQWERYEVRGSADTYNMVSVVVAYVDEHMGQEPSSMVSSHEPC